VQVDAEHWCSAVLRILSESMSIEDISAKINFQPTRCHIKGEPYSKRNPKSRIRGENIWILESCLTDQDTLEATIDYFLSFLKEREDVIKSLQEECVFDIYCAYSSSNGQGGFTLEHKMLKEFTMYPIDLSINLYLPDRRSRDHD
jgi:hypothetical protein